MCKCRGMNVMHKKKKKKEEVKKECIGKGRRRL
jgi:hypothetical protein